MATTKRVPALLQEAMTRLNEATGHPQHPRYFLERREAVTNYDHAVWQIRKCVGKDSEEVSRWLTRSQVEIWIEGAVKTIIDERARLERDDRRSLLRRPMAPWARTIDDPAQGTG